MRLRKKIYRVGLSRKNIQKNRRTNERALFPKKKKKLRSGVEGFGVDEKAFRRSVERLCGLLSG